jgi:hypothetical protein
MALENQVLQVVQQWLDDPANRGKLEFFADIGSPELWLSWELAYAISLDYPGCDVLREVISTGAAGRVDIVVKDATETVWIELKVIWNNNNRGKVIASSVSDAIRGLNSGDPGIILVVAIGSHRRNADEVLTQLETSLDQVVETIRRDLDAGGVPMASKNDKRQIRVVGYEVAAQNDSAQADSPSLAAAAADQQIDAGEFRKDEYVGCGQCGRFWRYTGEPPAPVCPDCGCGWRDMDGLRHCREVMFAFWLCGLADRLADIPNPVPTRLGHRTLELLRRLRLDIRAIGSRHRFPPEVENW